MELIALVNICKETGHIKNHVPNYISPRITVQVEGGIF